jgi:hypothetical protein
MFGCESKVRFIIRPDTNEYQQPDWPTGHTIPKTHSPVNPEIRPLGLTADEIAIVEGRSKTN